MNARFSILDCIARREPMLMEGALGERLKREYGLSLNKHLDMGLFAYKTSARSALENLWLEYAGIAQGHGLPFIFTTPTRRTNKERAREAGAPDSVIADNVAFAHEVQTKMAVPSAIGVLVGCYGNAYTGVGCLGMDDAREFHIWELQRIAASGADFAYAALIPTLGEAAGITFAAVDAGVPLLLSLTVTPDGCLPDGTRLADAIEEIDSASGGYPIGFMSNCIHPSLMKSALDRPFNQTDAVRKRFVGLQANASSASYSTLDGSSELVGDNARDLADAMRELANSHPLLVFGGCCGTDGSHMEAIARVAESCWPRAS